MDSATSKIWDIGFEDDKERERAQGTKITETRSGKKKQNWAIFRGNGRMKGMEKKREEEVDISRRRRVGKPKGKGKEREGGGSRHTC